jgi:CTD kinase subunit alpha
VYKAKSKVTGELVALKRIRMETEKEGVCTGYVHLSTRDYFILMLSFCFQFPITAMREIKLLQKLRHKRIVQLSEIMVSKGNNQAANCTYRNNMYLNIS